jgi:hypothetical protein
MGIHLTDGIKAELGGVVPGVTVPMYFHKIRILVGAQQLTTMAGFAEQLSVVGLLGRRGFFENFIVKIDSSNAPPTFDLNKINRV